MRAAACYWYDPDLRLNNQGFGYVLLPLYYLTTSNLRYCNLGASFPPYSLAVLLLL